MGLKKVAIIGYGGMGGWHARHIQAGGAVELAGIYDISPERCQKAEERNIHVYASLEELLADPSVELVTIATPNHLHKALAIQVMAAGKNVISEKMEWSFRNSGMLFRNKRNEESFWSKARPFKSYSEASFC